MLFNIFWPGMGQIYQGRAFVGLCFMFATPEPEVQILVNLAPADLQKEGTWLDLPLAIILLQAAGGHNLLLIGPPGEGKSMLAKAMPGILPRLRDSEKVLLTKIHSACGQLERDGLAVTRRPMRSIHHTASKMQSLVAALVFHAPAKLRLHTLGYYSLMRLPNSVVAPLKHYDSRLRMV